MTKKDDRDYCFITTRLRSLENNMLNHERMEMILEASDLDEALKLLAECGYNDISADSPQSLEESLAAEREKIFQEIAFFSPDSQLVDVFRVKYDYHNAKVLLKAEALGIDANQLMSEAGRIPSHTLIHAVLTSSFIGIPGQLQYAIAEARELLGTTRDPQLADMLLDRAYYEEMFQLAETANSAFLRGYVRISIDAANLKSAVRTARIGKGADFLRSMLFTGGNIDVARIMEIMVSGAAVEEFYANSPLAEAAAASAAAIKGHGMTQFERLADDAVSRYLATARYVPFGEEAVIFHLAARETEFTAVRIIIAGMMAGLKADKIRERLREIYV